MGVANTAQPKLSPGHPLAGAFLRVLMHAHCQGERTSKQWSGLVKRRIARFSY